MEVILRVVDGPEMGKEFHFNEADNFLIGRKDPTSKAHLNVSPEDRYVSRHHFTIEVRPPNVMIRDFGSTNGTYLRHRGGHEWGERIDEALVSDGDQIKIGHTILAVEVIQPEPVGLPTIQDVQAPRIEKPINGEARSKPADKPIPPQPERKASQPEPVPQPQGIASTPPREKPKSEIHCIRCQTPLDEVPVMQEGSFTQEDFMCANCRSDVQAEREREEAARAAIRYVCHHCGADVTTAAKQDGRAAELAEVALYLCQGCADRMAKLRIAPIGDYRLLSELGHGGMGVVYKAWHPRTYRLVAIKQMLEIAKASKDMIRRFVREALIMEKLHDTGLVRLYEAGLKGSNPYFVSEFVPDGNLNQFMSAEDRPLLAPAAAAKVIASSLDGLEELHRRGFVHRDIKPENILVRKVNGTQKPKLADFGLARSYEEHGGTITRKGEYAGTIFYMPYEQITEFKEAQPPVDIYAMGVTLYYLLTGKFPLNFPSPHELKRGALGSKDPIRMIMEDQPRPIRERRPDLPPALCTIVDKAVSKEAYQRHQTAREFKAELEKFTGR